jgi:hypothetical protein
MLPGTGVKRLFGVSRKAFSATSPEFVDLPTDNVDGHNQDYGEKRKMVEGSRIPFLRWNKFHLTFCTLCIVLD